MRSLIFVLVAVAIIFAGGLSAVDAAYTQSGEDFNIQNETWTPDAGNYTSLNDSNLESAFYDDSVTVRDGSGKKMIAGEDYEWNSTNGTVKAVEGGRLDGESSAEISYEYNVPAETDTTVVSIFSDLAGVAAPLLIVLMLAIVFLAITKLGRV